MKTDSRDTVVTYRTTRGRKRLTNWAAILAGKTRSQFTDEAVREKACRILSQPVKKDGEAWRAD